MPAETPARTVLITGGAQGIGKGLTQFFLCQGWQVGMLDVDAEAGAEALAECAAPDSLMFVQADVAEESQVAAAITAVAARFGRLDGLINNAGIASPGHGPVETLALADWNRVIAVNLTGGFLCAKHAIPHLRQTRGAIVNIASTRAFQSEPNGEAYAASKGGVVALTHALALSLGPEIRVNCISPGWVAVSAWRKTSRRHDPQLSAVDHQQHPCGRIGVPDDIAALAQHLLSPAAGFITGQNFTVDGGMSKKMIYAP